MLLRANNRESFLLKRANLISSMEGLAGRASSLPHAFPPLSTAQRLRMIEEPMLPPAILQKLEARRAGMRVPLHAPPPPNPTVHIPVGSVLPEEEVLAKTFVPPSGLNSPVRPMESQIPKPPPSPSQMVHVPAPAQGAPSSPTPSANSGLVRKGLLGAGMMAGGYALGHDKEKAAFVGPLVGLAGRGAVKAGIGAGKGLVGALKTRAGRAIIGTGLAVGGMGLAGFKQGAGADLPYNPNSPYSEKESTPSYAAPSVPMLR